MGRRKDGAAAAAADADAAGVNSANSSIIIPWPVLVYFAGQVLVCSFLLFGLCSLAVKFQKAPSPTEQEISALFRKNAPAFPCSQALGDPKLRRHALDRLFDLEPLKALEAEVRPFLAVCTWEKKGGDRFDRAVGLLRAAASLPALRPALEAPSLRALVCPPDVRSQFQLFKDFPLSDHIAQQLFPEPGASGKEELRDVMRLLEHKDARAVFSPLLVRSPPASSIDDSLLERAQEVEKRGGHGLVLTVRLALHLQQCTQLDPDAVLKAVRVGEVHPQNKANPPEEVRFHWALLAEDQAKAVANVCIAWGSTGSIPFPEDPPQEDLRRAAFYLLGTHIGLVQLFLDPKNCSPAYKTFGFDPIAGDFVRPVCKFLNSVERKG